MRDVIWTIIVIWLVYKLFDFFKNASQKKSFSYTNYQQTNTNNYNANTNTPNKKDAIKKGTDNEGEYIDFEEVK